MNPLLIDLPESFESERLTIRCAMPGEGAETNTAVLESISELKLWMPWAKSEPTPDESEMFCRQAYAKFHKREDLTYRGWLKGTSTLVVSSGFHDIDWDVPRFEIGYWVRTAFVGRGYASEIVHALSRFAFEQLKAERIDIRMDDLNERSWRVAERCGFRLEGVFRNDSRGCDGQLRNTRVYSKLRGE